MAGLTLEQRNALTRLIDLALLHAETFGASNPPYAIALYRAVAEAEPLTRQGDPSEQHWEHHVDQLGALVAAVPGCLHCEHTLNGGAFFQT